MYGVTGGWGGVVWLIFLLGWFSIFFVFVFLVSLSAILYVFTENQVSAAQGLHKFVDLSVQHIRAYATWKRTTEMKSLLLLLLF